MTVVMSNCKKKDVKSTDVKIKEINVINNVTRVINQPKLNQAIGDTVVWAYGAHDIATKLQVTVQVYRFGHSRFAFQQLVQVLVNCLCILHPRSTQIVHKWCKDITYTSLSVSLQMAP